MNRIILVMLMVCASSTGFIFSQDFSEKTSEAVRETDNLERDEETNEAAGEAGNIELKEKLHNLIGKSDKIELKLDFPLFDFPYQIDTMNTAGYGFFGSYSSLSMDQSLALTMDVYSSMHFGLKKLYDSLTLAPIWKNVIYIGGTAAGILTFAYVLPFGYPWMQQEYRRSILSRFDISSRNVMYDIFNTTAGYGVTDAQLERFKAENPHDMIRMYEAGTEGYILFSDHMMRNRFFYDLDNLSNYTALFASIVGIIFPNAMLLNANSTGAAAVDMSTNVLYDNDGGEESRMLYGNSSINWVYDLFRPDEPYSARGIHPSGSGIARYITWEQLSGDERDYLTKQVYLSLLNFSSPLLAGLNAFPLGKSGLKGNFAVYHYLTSFGSDVPVQIFLKKAPFNMLFTWHSYQNYHTYFPAIEAQLFEFPLQFTPKFGLLLSPRVLLGAQPKNQEFRTSAPEFLGLFGLRVDFVIDKHILPFIDFSVKTAGWVAGNEYLNANASVKLGVSLRY
ncbi:hypothetical protein FACS189473_1900 [Spirochaetia bacterium]|nr:hypothetical protein FACS189473_1900 [Spirochaetia bacterium]